MTSHLQVTPPPYTTLTSHTRMNEKDEERKLGDTYFNTVTESGDKVDGKALLHELDEVRRGMRSIESVCLYHSNHYHYNIKTLTTA